MPAAPRCKVCASPFHGVGGTVAKLIWHGPTRGNPLLCKRCFGRLADHPGGTEVEVSVLFADVRGSTGLAEHETASEFRGLIQDYYVIVAQAVDRSGGIVDKYLGDGVMALFIPVITGENHAARAIEAGRAILADVERAGLPARGARVGAGVHTGPAFVGAIGAGDKLDFTAIGDTVNVGARLGSVAAGGELLVSRAAWEAAGLAEESGATSRALEIVGRSAPLEVFSLQPTERASTS
jgi:adenylate cyclase